MSGWLGLAVLCLVGCEEAGVAPSANPGAEAADTLTVFAAASLRDAIEEVGAAFGRERGVGVVGNYAGSGTLARQILAAPRADVFLSASPEWMDVVEEAGRIGEGTRRTFLSNSLALVGHPRSSWRVEAASDLADLSFAWLSIGDLEAVPAGAYAREWLESISAEEGNSLWATVEGRVAPAHDARAALTQVEGRRDVIGIVYLTDWEARRDRVRLLYRVPVEEGPAIRYCAGRLAASPSEKLAEQFLDFLSSGRAQEIFRRHGFLPIAGDSGRTGEGDDRS